MQHGYSLDWIASDLDVPKRRIQKWILKDLLPGPGRQGRGATYPPAFLFRARRVRDLYDRFPRGPLDLIRTRLDAADGVYDDED